MACGGVTFVNLVDPDCLDIQCFVDINPNKQHSHIPGTGHPVIAPARLEDEEWRRSSY